MEDKPGAVLHLCMITAHQHMNGQQQILAVRHCEEQALALRARATKQSPCNEKQTLEICGVELWNGGQAGCCSSSVHDYSASAYEWAATNTRQSPLAIQSYTRHLVFKYTTTSLTRCVLHSHRWFLRLIARTLLQGDCFAASAQAVPWLAMTGVDGVVIPRPPAADAIYAPRNVRHCGERALALRARATKQSPCTSLKEVEL